MVFDDGSRSPVALVPAALAPPDARALAVYSRQQDHRRRALDALLLDGECRQTLACLRAYSRQGLVVAAVTCREHAGWAPTLRSRSCAMGAVLPDVACRPDDYIDALLSLLRERPTPFVLPAHDGSIEALRSRRQEVERLTALGLSNEPALSIAVSKSRTLALARELGVAIPRSIDLTDTADIGHAINHIGLPAVIKPDRSWVQLNGSGQRLTCSLVKTEYAAKQRLEAIWRAGAKPIMQQWLQGRHEAVSLFYAKEKMWARFAQASHREWPVMGGVSVLCESIPLLPDITAAAERLVRAINLEGCSMVEFRRDLAGQPVLMEVNPRLGASVALAIGAGINLPWLMYSWKLNLPLQQHSSYQTGRRLRWLSGDIWNLKSVLRQPFEPDRPHRAEAVKAFLEEFLRPNSIIDLLEIRDMKPAVYEMKEMLLRHAWSRARAASPTRQFTTNRIEG